MALVPVPHSEGRKLVIGEEGLGGDRPRPVFDTDSKIPIGKMNYLERQRLREEMVLLDSKRAAAIEKKKKEKHVAFLKRVAQEKSDQRQKQDQRAHIIEAERHERMVFQLQERK